MVQIFLDKILFCLWFTCYWISFFFILFYSWFRDVLPQCNFAPHHPCEFTLWRRTILPPPPAVCPQILHLISVWYNMVLCTFQISLFIYLFDFQLYHTRVIDTSLLYGDCQGVPLFKSSLRNLARQHLK